MYDSASGCEEVQFHRVDAGGTCNCVQGGDGVEAGAVGVGWQESRRGIGGCGSGAGGGRDHCRGLLECEYLLLFRGLVLEGDVC